MERIDGVVGNVHADGELAALRDDHRVNGTLERVVIDADDRRRSRFRATTDAGTDVGVVLDRPAVSVGDVLLVDGERMILVAFEPREALAVELPDPTANVTEAAVELGHRIGNQHWDLAVEDGTVYVPLEADRHIVERVVADVVPGAEVRATTVEADLFVTELEGDTDREHDHSHGGDPDTAHGTDHGHVHGDNHDHEHDHGHASDHAHDHHDH